MSNSFWSENILNLATFLTSVISLLTLNELKKQRNLANSPKLHITSKNDIILAKNIWMDEVEASLPILWDGKFLKETKPRFPPMYSIPLNLINIGSTPALNVEITWNYDNEGREIIKNIFKQFNELDLILNCEVPYDIYKGSIPEAGLLTISKKNHLKGIYLMNLMPFNTDSIFPISESNRGTDFFIPYPHALIIAFELSVLRLSKKDHKFSVPTLYADISYYDNINLLHKDKFSINSNCYGSPWKNVTEDRCEEEFESVAFTIETRKINGNTYLNNKVEVMKKLKLKYKHHIHKIYKKQRSKI